MTNESSELKIKNRCPHCEQVVEIPTHLNGETIKCPNEACGQIFRVTVPEGEPAEDAEPAQTGIAVGDTRAPTRAPIQDEAVLYRIHPAAARQRPLRALVAALATVVGIAALALWAGQRWELTETGFGPTTLRLLLVVGLLLTAGSVLLFVWWWVLTLFTSLTITNKRTTYQEGIIARETSEVQHDDVRNLQIDQGLVERVLGVGNVAISSAGQDDMEIEVAGIPHPDRVAETIREYQ